MYYDVEKDIVYFACLSVVELMFLCLCIVVLYEAIKYIARMVRNGKQ
jgi:hypothetical protein